MTTGGRGPSSEVRFLTYGLRLGHVFPFNGSPRSQGSGAPLVCHEKRGSEKFLSKKIFFSKNQGSICTDYVGVRTGSNRRPVDPGPTSEPLLGSSRRRNPSSGRRGSTRAGWAGSTRRYSRRTSVVESPFCPQSSGPLVPQDGVSVSPVAGHHSTLE